MGKPDRTPKRWPLLPVLHTSRFSPTTSRISLSPKHYWVSKLSGTPILNTTPIQLLIKRFHMTSMHNSLYSKNTTIWPPSLTTQSSCRSPYCRLHGPCSNSTKIRRIRYITDYNIFKPTYRIYSISLYYTVLMRHNYNQLNLPPPDRSQIINCLLLRQSYSTRHCSYPHSDTLKLYGSHSLNNRPRPHLIHTLLSSKFQL